MSGGYVLRLVNGATYYVDSDGFVIARSDGPPDHNYSKGWRITGIAKRHHSRRIITLADAANGADIGQGWVHDWDYGTHRMWGGGGRRIKSVSSHR